MNNLQISHEFWEINGIRMHVALAGSGPTIILLHGFPEIWYSWRNLIPLLAEKFRVIAPDLRGCGQTQITKKGYDLETLTRDVVASPR
jgi:haloacetate dehalogenase